MEDTDVMPTKPFAIIIQPVPSDQIAEMRRRYKRLNAARRNIKPALRLIGREMEHVIDLTFQSQGRRGGGSWPELKQATRYSKMMKGYDPRILFATTALYNSLTKTHSPNHIFKITSNDEIIIGSRLGYAAVHYKGAPTKHIPIRRWYKPTAGDRKNYRTILMRFFHDAYRGTGAPGSGGRPTRGHFF